MQHLGINFRGIWRLNLVFFIWVYLYFYLRGGQHAVQCGGRNQFRPNAQLYLGFLLKKSGLIFRSTVATLLPTPQLTYIMWSICVSCNAIIYPS